MATKYKWKYRITIQCISVQTFVQTDEALISMLCLYTREIIARRVPQGSEAHMDLEKALSRLVGASTYAEVAPMLVDICVSVELM